MRPIDLMMDRLAELAAGAEPIFLTDGLCNNATTPLIQRMDDSYSRAWEVLQEAFRQLGLNPIYPLGEKEFRSYGSKWTGRRGQRRRKLAYRVLVLLIRTFGYQGEYR